MLHKQISEEIQKKKQCEHIVGGVNSPSRSYKAVGGGAPTVMEQSRRCLFL